MSDRLSSITGGASSLPGIIPPQVNEGAGGFKTTGGSSVSITPGERNADSMNVGVPESQANGKSVEDRTAQQTTAEAFADSKHRLETTPPADAATPASEPPPEAAPPVDVVVAVSGDSPKATPPAAAGITLTN
jgi:hypothetical protein